MASEDRPLFSYSFAPDAFIPSSNSVYIYGLSIEERSTHVDNWAARDTSISFVKIDSQEGNAFQYATSGSDSVVSLRNSKTIVEFWRQFQTKKVYLDITGLTHSIWAPLVKYGLGIIDEFFAVYVEPDDYRPNITPTEGQIFDLSEKIKGISPIPGFVSLREPKEDEVCFIPLLGFEGTRLSFLIEQVQPPGGKIFPIIGVPGFRPEYPFYTYSGNKLPLMEKKAWKNTRYATANCPFSVLHLLKEIASENSGDLIKIAPIGTKPHALGAILFASTTEYPIELVYDHPIRKSERTKGAARILVYNITPIAYREK